MVADDLEVSKTSENSKTSDSKVISERRATEHQQFIRQAYNTSSARPARTYQPHTSDMLKYQQMALMRATMRMHRNPLMMYNRPFTARQSQPIPSDWTTDSSLRARRRPIARIPREDLYIMSAKNKPDHETLDNNALPLPDSQVQETLPASATEQPSHSPPVPVRQPRNRRRRTRANVDNDNSLVNGADSSPAANESEEPVLSDVATSPTNVTGKETDVDCVVSDTSAHQNNAATTSRRSLVFEKVHSEVSELAVTNRRRVTERHLPLHESSV